MPTSPDQENRMSPRSLVIAALSLVLPLAASAQQSPGPYKILRTVKIGGEGGFDYVTADPVNRNLYVARSGPTGHIGVYNLDSLAPIRHITGVSAHAPT